MDIGKLRQNIDEIDKKIVALIEDRMEVSEDIARYKIENGKSVFDKTREEQKLTDVKALASKDKNKEPVGELYEKIMEVSRKRQYETLSDNNAVDENASCDPVFGRKVREVSSYEELILYRNATPEQTKLLRTIIDLSDEERSNKMFTGQEQISLIHQCMNSLIDECSRRGLYGNLWHAFLTLLLVSDENAYSCGNEVKSSDSAVAGSLEKIALQDMMRFKNWFDIDFSGMIERLDVPAFEVLLDYCDTGNTGKVFNKRVRDRICELSKALSDCSDAEGMLDEVTSFYRHFGVGKFGLHKAFRVKHDDEEARIQPIRNIRHVQLADLVGYEIAKQKLIENTEAFVEGRRANNCLLYGDAGTGKSTCIKAIANEYYEKGLRIIEIYKHQFKDLEDVITQIKGRNYKFIIYMDDLSFEEFETEYKYLKAVIEGGLEKKPDNVLIYATSNRRHLIKESFKDKPAILDDDLHRNDTVQEKLSLSNRFGVTIYFGSPEKKEFDEIVRVLARREGIEMDEDELVAEAQKWEMSHGGLSGRTAQQFIDHLLGVTGR